MEFDLFWYVIFFATGLFAGFIDSIAGGGGIITVPVLFASGLPPHIALGTNKLQGSFGTLSASINFAKKGLIDFKELFLGIVFTFIGAIIGTQLILFLNADFLKKFIPIMLIAIFIYTFFSPKIGEEDKKNLLNKNVFYIFFGLLLGFYDGFFGPGAGSFWMFALVGLLGINLKSATAKTKVLNLTSNLVSLFVFFLNDAIFWIVGLIMGLGQMIGAYLGSNLVVKKEAKFVRIFFLIVVGITILKLVYDNYL